MERKPSMKRKVIEIDEERCNGCGLCIPNCPEGALQVIDGKVRLISDYFCDGLGACVGECPQGALHVAEREAEPYDEKRVMENIIRQGTNTIRAHLKHLQDHGEKNLYNIAVEVLKEKGIEVPEAAPAGKLPCGCPGTLARLLKQKPPEAPAAPVAGHTPSALRQWPVQLHLLNPAAPYFDDAELLVCADCVAYAHGDFHTKLLPGKILIIFCPKLDHSFDEYAEKLADIFTMHNIRSVTVARMEVPCCGGTVAIVEKALEMSGKNIPVEVKIIGIDGNITRNQ